MSETSVLANALALAKRGLAVFPANWPIEHRGRVICSCRSELRGQPPCSKPAKHPHGLLVPNGLLDASTQSWQIKLWWQRAPQANLGLECTGLVVLDVDPDDDGDTSLRKLEAEHGPLPHTWRSITGRLGQHLFFRCPSDIEIPNVTAKNTDDPPCGAGIDVRSAGGFIIAPPSRHINGRRYCWDVDFHPSNTAIAPAPPWLIELLTARSTNSSKGHDPEQWAARKAEKFTLYRDAEVASVCGKLLRAISLDPGFVLTLVLAWNQSHCDPPLPADEVEDIFERICKSEIKRREAENAA